MACPRRTPNVALYTTSSRISSSPDIVESISEEEFRQSMHSSLSHGERGADVEQMRDFWAIRGLSNTLTESLAQRAESHGGIWADPPMLSTRIKAVLKMTAPMPLERLVRKCPAALQSRPETIAQKIETLARCLPGVDAIKLVTLEPILLQRSPETIESRIRSVMAALPRTDMQQIIARQPQLLRVMPEELAMRVKAIRAAYVSSTVASWDARHAARMLNTSSRKLSRLSFVESLSPNLRIVVPDAKLLRMKEPKYYERFESKKSSRWGRKRAAVAARLSPRTQSPLGDETIPPRGNMLAWGRQKMEELVETAEISVAVQGSTHVDAQRSIDQPGPRGYGTLGRVKRNIPTTTRVLPESLRRLDRHGR